MDGAIIPSDLFIQSPWWRNLFENPKTVQFVHRMFAYTVLVLAVIHAVQVWKNAAATTHARRTIVLLGLILVQAAIGIVTLLMSVPLDRSRSPCRKSRIPYDRTLGGQLSRAGAARPAWCQQRT